MVREIGQATVKNPTGYVGNLTDEQDAKLREAWREYFALLDRAKGSNDKKQQGEGSGGQQQQVVDDPKKAGTPKDDAAKEEARKKEEQQAMDDLVQEYGADALRDAFWKFAKLDDPDTGILRFLRARKWDVGRAMAMLAGCMKWRLDYGVEDLVERGDLENADHIEKYLDQHRSGKVYTFGSSVEEHPIVYIHVRKHFTKGQPAESMHKFIAYEMETFRLLLVPPNDKVILFFDLNGFGLKNMDWSAILYILKCLEAYFPESLHTLIIYKAPWIFSGIWKILGPLLDPVVRSKVVFMSGPSECAHLLPADRLTEELGGSVEFNWDERWVEPEQGDNDLQRDTAQRDERRAVYMRYADEYEAATKAWADGSAEDSAADLEKRRLLTKKLRCAQFELDPFWRGKTVLHRDGTLDGQGKVTWIYNVKDGEPIRHVVGRRHCYATLKREIREMEEDGVSSKEAEAKSDKALEEHDWVALYGSEELAQKLEGKRVQGEVPEIGEDNSQAISLLGIDPKTGRASGTANGGGEGESDGKNGKSDSKKDKSAPKEEQKHGEEAAGAAAAAGGAGAAAAAASSSSSSSDGDKAEPPPSAPATTDEAFHDAPQADAKLVKKAASKDHIAVPQDEEAAAEDASPNAATGHPIRTESIGNGTANGGAAEKKKASDYGSEGGGKAAKVKDVLKEKAVDAPKDKVDGIGRRLSRLMKRSD